jgi:hypothetical protein
MGSAVPSTRCRRAAGSRLAGAGALPGRSTTAIVQSSSSRSGSRQSPIIGRLSLPTMRTTSTSGRPWRSRATVSTV